MPNYILVIAYNFPPIGGSGVQRIQKFVKYLPSFGWQPIVLTVTENEKVLKLRDYSLLEELSPEIIVRTNLFEPYDNILHRFMMGTRSKFSEVLTSPQDQKPTPKARSKIGAFLNGLLIPDRVVGWFPYATRSGVRLIRKYRPKAIYSSSPPETAHVIALFLSSKFNIPWIADFRDPWTQFEFSRNRLYPFIKIERCLEKKVLEKASNVLTVTEECRDSFLSLYPSLDKKKFHVIPNGYDEEDFRQIKPKVFDKLTIIFTGNLYHQTPPKEIFQALYSALKEKSEMRRKCQFLFIGKQYAAFSELIKKCELQGIVKTISYQEHHKCLSYLLGSDICYYNFSSDLLTNKPLHHSAKLYEYLRSGTFIFAVIPENLSVSKIINEANAGVVVDPQNIEKMRNELLSLFEIYIKKNKIPKRSSKVLDITNFDRKSHTQKIGNLLNKFKKR